MNTISRTALATVLVTLGLAPAAPVRAGETELVGAQTPWRVFLRMGPYVGRKDGALVGTLIHNRESKPGDFAKTEFLKDWTARHTPSPADGWFRADFDDNTWGRYQTDELGDLTGGYGGGFEFPTGRTWPDRFHLRTCFGISDPAAAKDLSLELAYLGGAVVYLNGKEVGRQHLPAGSLDAAVFAEDYPAEAYLAEDGTTFLPALGKKNMEFEAKWKDRYEQRIRRLTLRLPAESLVKGTNVLAVEIRRAPVSRLGRTSWDHAGFHSARLVSASGKGTVAWTAAIEKTCVRNRGAMCC